MVTLVLAATAVAVMHDGGHRYNNKRRANAYEGSVKNATPRVRGYGRGWGYSSFAGTTRPIRAAESLSATTRRKRALRRRERNRPPSMELNSWHKGCGSFRPLEDQREFGGRRAHHSKNGWGQLLQLTSMNHRHGESLQEKQQLLAADLSDGAAARQWITLLAEM